MAQVARRGSDVENCRAANVAVVGNDKIRVPPGARRWAACWHIRTPGSAVGDCWTGELAQAANREAAVSVTQESGNPGTAVRCRFMLPVSANTCCHPKRPVLPVIDWASRARSALMGFCLQSSNTERSMATREVSRFRVGEDPGVVCCVLSVALPAECCLSLPIGPAVADGAVTTFRDQIGVELKRIGPAVSGWLFGSL